MRHLEDKRLCPHCGRPVHERPYLMSRGKDLVRGWQWMCLLLAFVIAFGLFDVLARLSAHAG